MEYVLERNGAAFARLAYSFSEYNSEVDQIESILGKKISEGWVSPIYGISAISHLPITKDEALQLKLIGLKVFRVVNINQQYPLGEPL